MTSFYDLPQTERETKGIDYDLSTCLEYNEQSEFSIADIEKVLAVWEGANDSDNWRWIIALSSGQYVYLNGWCDYTGWDCQSGAYCVLFDDPISACLCETEQDVKGSLSKQVNKGKNITWREKMDNEFGV